MTPPSSATSNCTLPGRKKEVTEVQGAWLFWTGPDFEKSMENCRKTIYIYNSEVQRARKRKNVGEPEGFGELRGAPTVRSQGRAEGHSLAISDVHIKMNPNFPDPRKLPACISLYINKPIRPHHINAGVNRLNSELGRFQ